jgi:hypothetical protein
MDTDALAVDTNVPVEDNAIAIDGLKQQDLTEGAAAAPNAEPTTSPKKAKSPAKKTAPPQMGMAAQNSCARKALEKYVPSMKGKKYAIASIQITSFSQGSKEGRPVHGAEVGEVDGEGSAQMHRYHWHGHGTSVHEGSPEEMGQGCRASNHH